MAAFDALYLRSTIQMTPGRNHLVAQEIKKLLRPAEGELFAFVQRAEASALKAHSMRTLRKQSRQAVYSPEAVKLDQALDLSHSAVYGLLDSYARGLPEESEDRRRAVRLRDAFYPRSLEAATKPSYGDELVEVRRIMALVTGELAADVAAVPGLSLLLGGLEQAAAALQAAIPPGAAQGASFAEAKDAVQESERRMAELVAAIVAHHHGDEPEARQRRAELLAVYDGQQDLMRRRYRRREPIEEVDPVTGAPLEEYEVDPVAPAGAAKAREPAE